MADLITRPHPLVPSFLQRLHTDEFLPPLLAPQSASALLRVHALTDPVPGSDQPAYWSGRRGTAAGLLALNEAWGGRYYQVPDEAVRDQAAADEALGGDQVVIDVQTHYLSDRPGANLTTAGLLETYRAAMPGWWKGLDDVTAFNFAEYLRCVYLETENAVAVLTSGPGRDENRMLFNDEIAATRRLIDTLGPQGRLLNHAIVHPTHQDDLDAMEEWRDDLKPVGWKVYTLGQMSGIGMWQEGEKWMLDDEKTGVKFLDRVRELDTRLVCAHKGLARLVDAGSPRDVGPAAKGYPDIDFVIYHSGYEWAQDPTVEEGPYSEDVANFGSNRLVKTLKDAGVGPGENVYAELGTTWFAMIKRPREAAHVLGKLLLAVGEDNVIWGTDSIWYGPPQPALDAFRAFQIPAELRERHGYPELTPRLKGKVLSLNASRLYGIDLAAARHNYENDDLAWIRHAVAEYREKGMPKL